MPLQLSDDERELLLTEVAQALDQVRAPEMRVSYGELLAAADAREVPGNLLEPLQLLLEIGLESGRIRKVHLAEGEATALRVYGRTPRGRALKESVEAANGALAGLAGQSLEEVTITPRGPATYQVRIATDQGSLLLTLDRHGARIQSLEIG